MLTSWRAFENHVDYVCDETGKPVQPLRELGNNRAIAQQLIEEEAAEQCVPTWWASPAHPDKRNQLIYKIVETQWALLSSYKSTSTEPFEDHFNGVPQGTPLSPILSILALVPTLQEQRQTVMYADDGVIYGKDLPNDPFPEEVKPANITVNQNKSGWIRRKGKWLQELKFLGLVYNPFTRKFQAKTRSGSVKEFDKFHDMSKGKSRH